MDLLMTRLKVNATINISDVWSFFDYFQHFFFSFAGQRLCFIRGIVQI